MLCTIAHAQLLCLSYICHTGEPYAAIVRTHVNRWYGSPGQLLMSRDASQHPDKLGFLNYTGALQAGDDIKVENGTTVAAAEAYVFLIFCRTVVGVEVRVKAIRLEAFRGNGHRLVH